MVKLKNRVVGDLVYVHGVKLNGEEFSFIYDKKGMKLVKKPEKYDLDISTAVSHIYCLLAEGQKIPENDCAAWG